MKKNRAVITMILAVLAIIGFGYIAFVGIGAGKTGSMGNIKQGLDLAGGVSITYQVVGDESPSAEDMSDTIYKLQKRVENYSTEAQVYQEGNDRINIEIPGVSDANAILEELGRPGSLYFIKQTDSDGNQNYTIGVTEDGTYDYVLLKDLNTLMEDGSIVLDGTMVSSAQAATVQSDSGTKDKQYVVSLTFTEEGKQAFADATTDAYSKGETIGIYYDGRFVSVPRVDEPILGGQAQISGQESFEEADTLASTIRIGGLKVELEELHSKVVGAQLGGEAIATSIKAGLIGFAIIVVFMIAIYYISGVAASLALTLYVELIIILLNGFDITLTLPGIAGIILSVGMAVDANVIIFARIREELAAGRTVKTAIDIGFKKAQSAIIDGNITTLIAAAVLAVMGSGTVKGFAYTLALGIVLSMFTAMVVTKLIMKAFFALGLTNPKLYGVARERKAVRFTKKKAVFFTASLIVIIAGFVFMGVNKAQTGNPLNYSLEFVGGTSTSVTFNEDMSLADIDSKVVPLIEDITGDGNVQTQKIDGTNEVIFKTRSLTQEERESFKDAMTDNFEVDGEKITAETISSTISNEMKQESIVAVLVAAVFMLIYVWLRFKDVRFGASSVLCLLHDVLVVLTFYAVAKVSVGTTFIACMLTIVGYSINATIVIFDRVRENMRSMSQKDGLEPIVDTSITQTLSRSIFTSLTTFIMVAMLYIFGVTSVKEFALPLMVGILCGAYSSVCIAGSLWLVLRKCFAKKNK